MSSSILIKAKEFEYKVKKFKYNRAMRIIQRGCVNWIDKPITNDGKYGISVRLLLHNVN